MSRSRPKIFTAEIVHGRRWLASLDKETLNALFCFGTCLTPSSNGSQVVAICTVFRGSPSINFVCPSPR